MALTKRGREAAELLNNPNVRTMLDLIAAAEGASQGYQTAFGGSVIEDLSDHPRTRHRFRETTGKRNVTTAAGRYQFLESTWDDVAKRLGLGDFEAESQDLAAIELLRRAGALDAVVEGDFSTALEKSGTTWASLPSSPYAQPTRSQKWVDNFLAQQSGAPPLVESPAIAAAEVQTQDAASDIQADLMSGLQNLAQTQAPMTLDAPAPSWLDSLQASMASASLPESPAPSIEPWEDQLIQDSLNDEADDARSRAVATFFGTNPVPQATLPRGLERFINQLLARL